MKKLKLNWSELCTSNLIKSRNIAEQFKSKAKFEVWSLYDKNVFQHAYNLTPKY